MSTCFALTFVAQSEIATCGSSKRLESTVSISEKVRKILWARSGNRCAYCRHELVQPATALDDPTVTGDECHIVSSKPGGPRYDPFFVENHDSHENLILLCKVDHKRVDDQTGAYSVEILQNLKRLHEANVSGAMMHLFSAENAPKFYSGAPCFRTMIYFAPDQTEDALEAFHQMLMYDASLDSFGRIGTGYKPRDTGRYASWMQTYIPVSDKSLRDLANRASVRVLEITHESLTPVPRHEL